MTGGGLALPCPVYKYYGRSLSHKCGVCSGFTGFAVSRHVHLTFSSGRIKTIAFCTKFLVYLIYAWYVGLFEKAYLEYGHLEGISRIQLQHPVAGCNPLAEKGCDTAFTSVKKLPYCKQNPHANKSWVLHPCIYLDEFDVAIQGEIPRKTLFVPTRVTKFSQTVDCTDAPADEPCPKKTKLVEESTTYIADIEDFTVLIDHSFVSDELNREMNAFKMIGFVNPCGEGSKLDERFFGESRDLLKQGYHSMQAAKKKECKGAHAEYQPIIPHEHVLKGHMEEKDIRKMERGIAMWLSPGLKTLFGSWATPDFEEVMEERKHAHVDPVDFHKLPNGDFISIGHLLKLAGVELDTPPEDANRHEGLVVVLNIEYTNVKENTWPNAIPPAYFYSVWLAPANEYKVMQQTMGQKRMKNGDKREILDQHGIFIVVKQGGHVGVFSFGHVLYLVFVFMAVDSLYRSVFICCVFNTNHDFGREMKKDRATGKEVALPGVVELDHKVTFDFELHGYGDEFSEGGDDAEQLLERGSKNR